jgi:hypothetical protein
VIGYQIMRFCKYATKARVLCNCHGNGVNKKNTVPIGINESTEVQFGKITLVRYAPLPFVIPLMNVLIFLILMVSCWVIPIDTTETIGAVIITETLLDIWSMRLERLYTYSIINTAMITIFSGRIIIDAILSPVTLIIEYAIFD